MKFGRDDYDKAITVDGKVIPEEEPGFLIRSKDPHAPVALFYYATVLERAGADAAIVKSVREHAGRMAAYRVSAGIVSTNPDLPRKSAAKASTPTKRGRPKKADAAPADKAEG